MYHFKAETLFFSSNVFQIKILWFGGMFIALIVGWILEILECYFYISGKSKHKSAVAARNINAAFGNSSINEYTTRY